MFNHPTVSDEAYQLGLVLIGARTCKHYKGEDCGFCQAEAVIAAGYRLIPASPENHVIEFREDDWTIQHPLSCRPNLFHCPTTRAATHRLSTPAELGRFECWLESDRLVVGDRIEDSHDQA